MTDAKYGVGDLVYLGNGPFKHVHAATEFKIVAVLPVSNGQIQYQVRSDEEGFDRRVPASEIDVERSIIAVPKLQKVAAKAGGSWLKPLSLKVHK